MEYQILKTRLVSDTVYVDLISLDGNIMTHLMKKKEEPNVFESIKSAHGDVFDTIDVGENLE